MNACGQRLVRGALDHRDRVRGDHVLGGRDLDGVDLGRPPPGRRSRRRWPPRHHPRSPPRGWSSTSWPRVTLDSGIVHAGGLRGSGWRTCRRARSSAHSEIVPAVGQVGEGRDALGLPGLVTMISWLVAKISARAGDQALVGQLRHVGLVGEGGHVGRGALLDLGLERARRAEVDRDRRRPGWPPRSRS